MPLSSILAGFWLRNETRAFEQIKHGILHRIVISPWRCLANNKKAVPSGLNQVKLRPDGFAQQPLMHITL